VQLLEALAGHVATAIGNARLFQRERLEKERALKELEEARQVQTGLFPAQSPALPGFTIDGRCIPCREVAGDWFDYLQLDDGRLGVQVSPLEFRTAADPSTRRTSSRPEPVEISAGPAARSILTLPNPVRTVG